MGSITTYIEMTVGSPWGQEGGLAPVTGRCRERRLTLALGLLVATLVFGVAEALARFLYRVPPAPYPVCAAPPQGGGLYTWDAERFWRPRANLDVEDGFYRTNSLGLRDDEFPKRTEEDRASVLVLGDSPTWGWRVPVADTYPRVLERLLAEARPGVPVEVLNAGVCAYSTQQSLLLERSLFERFPFDLVIVNSMGSDRRSPMDSGEDKDFVYSPLRSRLNALAVHSALLGFLRDQVTGRARTPRRPPVEQAWVSRVSVEDYQANLEAMVAEATAHRAHTILMPPMPLHDSSADHVDGREKALEPRYQQAMRAAADASGAAYLDLPARVEGLDPGDLYLDATHPTPRGHLLIAVLLRDAVLPHLDAGFPGM